MAHDMLVESQLTNSRVTPVDVKNPPQDYLNLNVGRHLPDPVVTSGLHPKTGDDMTDYIVDSGDETKNVMDRYKCPDLELIASAHEATEEHQINGHLPFTIRDPSVVGTGQCVSKEVQRPIDRSDEFLIHGADGLTRQSSLRHSSCPQQLSGLQQVNHRDIWSPTIHPGNSGRRIDETDDPDGRRPKTDLSGPSGSPGVTTYEVIVRPNGATERPYNR